jgi:hypothetical protein
MIVLLSGVGGKFMLVNRSIKICNQKIAGSAASRQSVALDDQLACETSGDASNSTASR